LNSSKVNILTGNIEYPPIQFGSPLLTHYNLVSNIRRSTSSFTHNQNSASAWMMIGQKRQHKEISVIESYHRHQGQHKYFLPPSSSNTIPDWNGDDRGELVLFVGTLSSTSGDEDDSGGETSVLSLRVQVSLLDALLLTVSVTAPDVVISTVLVTAPGVTLLTVLITAPDVTLSTALITASGVTLLTALITVPMSFLPD
jgi:hypothetical protein